LSSQLRKRNYYLSALLLASGLAAAGASAQNADQNPGLAQQPSLPAGTVDLRRNSGAGAGSAGSQTTPPTFFVHGKPVSEDRYRAAVLASDALQLMKANQNDQAAEKLRQAVQLAPDLPEAHHNLGLVMAKLGDVPHAIDELNTAIKLKPDLDASWLTLGGLHQSAGHISEAIATYNQFLLRFKTTPPHPMYGKIQNLVKGLSDEQKSMTAAKNAAAALPPPTSSQHGVLQVAPQAATTSGQDDYVAEVTRSGVLRWPSAKMPIRVYLHPAALNDSNGQPTGYKKEYLDILMKSFQDWATASEGLVSFQFVNSPKEATLECLWVSNAKDLNNPAEAGEAKVLSDRDGLAKGTIKLLTKSLSSVLPLTDNRMRLICLHEIGHALGLAGHTANPDDIMFYSVSFKDEWKQLSGRDSRTIKRLYSGD
jgi:predicted Zn-dependent protease